jgi:hypothetical protein
MFFGVLAAAVFFCAGAWAQTVVDCNNAADGNDLAVYEFYGEAELDNFGTGLDCAGDFNNDGVADIVAGSPYHDTTSPDAGAAYLFLGGSPADSAWDFRLLGEAEDDQLGYAVAGAGDLDRDGFDDIAIGARFSDRTGTDRGAVWIVFGGDPPSGSRQLVLLGNANGPNGFGHSLAGGDFNGDGFSDLAVGAPFDVSVSAIDTELSRVYIFFGGSQMDAAADVVLEAEGALHQFGWSVACAGDLNKDTYDDLVVGASYYGSLADAQRGRLYVYFGGNPMDTTADVELSGENSYAWLGHSVAGAGDVNADGFDDLLVGSPMYPGGFNNPAFGRVYLLLGSSGTSMDNVPDVVFEGTFPHDQFGWDVDGGSDMNRDGYADVIIGSRFADCAGSDAGDAYVYYGGTAMDNVPDIGVGSTAAGDALGTAVAMVGNWSGASPLAAVGAVWNDWWKDVTDPMNEGAFGGVFAFAAPMSTPGDFDRNKCVNRKDLAVLTTYWLSTGCSNLNWCGETDLNRDTDVNLEDYSILAGRWLQGCE